MRRTASRARQRAISDGGPTAALRAPSILETPRAACSAGSPAAPRETNRPRRTACCPHARQQSAHHVDDDQRRQLAAAEHVVADRDLLVAVLPHAVVDSFVAPADEHDGSSRPAAPLRLRQPMPLRRRRSTARGRAARRAEVLDRATSGSGFITMPGPPPYGTSSTTRCRSVVKSRRSWTFRSMTPASTPAPGPPRPTAGRTGGRDRHDIEFIDQRRLGHADSRPAALPAGRSRSAWRRRQSPRRSR